jgi:hypothetical protein
MLQKACITQPYYPAMPSFFVHDTYSFCFINNKYQPSLLDMISYGPFSEQLRSIFERCRENRDGKNASYIPQLGTQAYY